jgi:Tol biopolymer transport system component
MRKLSILAFAIVASTTAAACTNATTKGDADGGAPETDGSSGGAGGSASEADASSGGANAGGSKGDGASPGAGGSPRADGSVGGGSADDAGGRSSHEGGAPVDGGGTTSSLPTSTFLYVKAQTADHDLLVARDLASGEERIVTDLTGDGSDGWEIWGASISPDRKRIAIASLFGPTKADNDTGLATRRIWTLNADGSDFERLTPVFPNTGAGRHLFSIEVDRPAFTEDGSAVIYNFGNYWYEGTTLKGGSLPWSISTAGGGLPMAFDTISTCSVLHPAVNPATGDVLFIHSVCIRSADQGLFLYPKGGGTAPTMLVQAGNGAGEIDPSLTPPSWLPDGSGFVFVGTTSVDRNGTTEVVPALFLYDMTANKVAPLVISEPNEYVQAAAIAPDASAIVYCLRHGSDAQDLHLIDLTTDPATDSPMTTDGKSCYPTF